jgi:hypothetical protein
MDDDKFWELIESLPEKCSRSRLEPYRHLIAELRRLRRTYREIAHILGEKCQVQVSAAAVHNFVRLHLRRKRNPIRRPETGFLAPPQRDRTAMIERPVNSPRRKRVTTSAVSDEEVRRRIEKLRIRRAPAETTPVLFHYDPNEPLHLLPKTEKNKSDDK